jgi:hypothetical protein
MTQQWPTDPQFQAFARKLADAVTVAINSGETVSSEDHHCHCPLGCLPASHEPRPFPLHFKEDGFLGIGRSNLWRFVRGFDGGVEVSVNDERSPYYRLGCAYRVRFP